MAGRLTAKWLAIALTGRSSSASRSRMRRRTGWLIAVNDLWTWVRRHAGSIGKRSLTRQAMGARIGHGEPPACETDRRADRRILSHQASADTLT